MNKLRYHLNRYREHSITDVFNQLNECYFNPQREYFEFFLKRDSITPDSLKPLIELGYEVSLVQTPKRLVLVTGDETSIPRNRDTLHMKKHKMWIHSHRLRRRKNVMAPTPSFSDIFLSAYKNPDQTWGLISPAGLLIYDKPIFDPDTNQTFCGGTEDLILIYCQNRGIDIHGFGIDDLNKWGSLTSQEQLELQRRFLEETGMIVDEASWDDPKGLDRVVNKLFGPVTNK